jgi:hypothetical protein
MRWAGHIARMGEMINAYKILVGKPKGRRTIVRPGGIWDYNIIIHLSEIGSKILDCIHLS